MDLAKDSQGRYRSFTAFAELWLNRNLSASSDATEAKQAGNKTDRKRWPIWRANYRLLGLIDSNACGQWI